MIAVVAGVLSARVGDAIILQTDGGVGYEVTVPLGVMERLPPVGQRAALHTELVIREDAWTLYGFDRPGDRVIFQRLLTASGFGPKLALAVLSSLGPERAVRSIQGKDVAALSTVPGIGRKKAERLILELHDRFADLAIEPSGLRTTPSAADEAARALVALGYLPAQADEAIRAALGANAEGDSASLIRRALQILTAPKGKGGRP
ncbi:MAG: Holliday junction branch migration protein RuvA [Gemmatimonadales bacterium]|nr:Holliday junction branch migration protein RuvA [Gemmatimonadales bacterium]